MTAWADPAAWARMRGGEECGVCRRGVPPDALAVLDVSWVGMGEDAPMRGYCFLMFHPRHAVELHDLSREEGAAFMHDIQRVSRAVQLVTGAVKMNYEVHGNTVPHLHAHLFPRYVGDPFEGKPIDPRSVRGPVYAPGELADVRRRVLAALAEPR
jgi:diadenosine tetraphosphate (Ap4A) HIT family hydrolase